MPMGAGPEAVAVPINYSCNLYRTAVYSLVYSCRIGFIHEEFLHYRNRNRQQPKPSQHEIHLLTVC